MGISETNISGDMIEQKTNRRKTGARMESAAADFLEKQGLIVLARNFHTRFSEIDLIARDQNVLCFIEVKYRKSTGCGFPAEAVTRQKQNRIRRGAAEYLMKTGRDPVRTCIRFDVIAILGRDIQWIPNAF